MCHFVTVSPAMLGSSKAKAAKNNNNKKQIIGFLQVYKGKKYILNY